MKLQIVIYDQEINGNRLGFGMESSIFPADREGIPTRDKSKQIAVLGRLIDLSDVIEEAVERFYQERIMSSPSNPINTSGEPGTT